VKSGTVFSIFLPYEMAQAAPGYREKSDTIDEIEDSENVTDAR